MHAFATLSVLAPYPTHPPRAPLPTSQALIEARCGNVSNGYESSPPCMQKSISEHHQSRGSGKGFVRGSPLEEFLTVNSFLIQKLHLPRNFRDIPPKSLRWKLGLSRELSIQMTLFVGSLPGNDFFAQLTNAFEWKFRFVLFYCTYFF